MRSRVPLLARVLPPSLALLVAAPALAQESKDLPPAPPVEEVSLTVYSHADPASFDPQRFIAQQRQGWNPYFAWQVPGFAVVKEVRRVQVPEGTGELRLTDVAEFIDPTTVSFADLDAPDDTVVIEQSFEFDLVSPSKLLQRYVDQEIDYLDRNSAMTSDDDVVVRGRVLSVNQGQVVLQTTEGLRFVHASDANIRLPKLPDGLITKPTLVWKLSAEQGGEHRIRTTYQTGGLTWRSDYNLVLNATDTQADLGAWVTLMNLSGVAYPDARLKLIAGDVQRIQPAGYAGALPMAGGARRSRAEASGFEEKSFFEYHLYTLPRRTEVKRNTTQQIALFPTAREVGVEKVLVYYGLPQAASWSWAPQPHQDRSFGNQSNAKVDVYVRFDNSEGNHLGMPLPKGKVRVYKRDDADGTLEFVGEDLIDHTPRDEEVLIRLGQSFDVVGERTQTDFRVDTRARWITETFKIEIRNHKDTQETVIVKENLYRWSNWEIQENSESYEKVDSRTIHFRLKVPARTDRVLTYKVRYTW